ncbi:hypothetical protein MM0352_02070 [Helicobacter pylori]
MRWNVLCLTLSTAVFQRFLRNKILSLPQKKNQKAQGLKILKKRWFLKKIVLTQDGVIGS